jgi:hypothetical protein
MLLTFGKSMERFDSGEARSAAEALLDATANTMLNPLFWLLSESDIGVVLFPGLLGYIPILANSAIWALAAWWLIVSSQRLLARTMKPSNPFGS